MFRVFPSRLVCTDEFLRRLFKRDGARNLRRKRTTGDLTFGDGVDASSDFLPQRAGAVLCACKGDAWIWPKADFSTTPSDHHPEQPAFVSCFANLQYQAGHVTDVVVACLGKTADFQRRQVFCYSPCHKPPNAPPKGAHYQLVCGGSTWHRCIDKTLAFTWIQGFVVITIGWCEMADRHPPSPPERHKALRGLLFFQRYCNALTALALPRSPPWEQSRGQTRDYLERNYMELGVHHAPPPIAFATAMGKLPAGLSRKNRAAHQGKT